MTVLFANPVNLMFDFFDSILVHADFVLLCAACLLTSVIAQAGFILWCGHADLQTHICTKSLMKLLIPLLLAWVIACQFIHPGHKARSFELARAGVGVVGEGVACPLPTS